MIVVFHMFYLVANTIWNKLKLKLQPIEEDTHKTISKNSILPDESKSWLYALEEPNGDLNSTEEYDSYDPNKNVCVYDQLSGKLTFVPPLYIQRYQEVVKVLSQDAHVGKIHTIVEYGCAECSMLKYYKKQPGVSKVLLVDIDEDLLIQKSDRVEPLTFEYMIQRETELCVRLFCGDVGVPDERMCEADAVVAIELIEHLYPPTLEAVPYNLFGHIQPPLVIITTPNGEFNHLFDDYVEGTFRHDDHKFEWSREQFRSWAENIVTRYPMYSLQISGIGPPPANKSEEQYGHCSQMAVFTRMGPRTAQSPTPDLVPTTASPYKLIKEVVYPQKPPETRSPEQILFDELTYLLFSWKQDMVPLTKLYKHLNPWCSSLDDLRKILERNCRKVIFNESEQQFYLVDESFGNPLLSAEETEEEDVTDEQYWNQQETVTGENYVADNSWESWDEPASSTGVLEVDTEDNGKLTSHENVDSAQETADSVRETKVAGEREKSVEETEVTEKRVNAVEETQVTKVSVHSETERSPEDQHRRNETTTSIADTRDIEEEHERKETSNGKRLPADSVVRKHENSTVFTPQDETLSPNSNEKASCNNTEVKELLSYLLAAKMSKLECETLQTCPSPGTPAFEKTEVPAGLQDMIVNTTDKGKLTSTVIKDESHIRTPMPSNEKSNRSITLEDRQPITMFSSKANDNGNAVGRYREDRGQIRCPSLEQYIRDKLQSAAKDTLPSDNVTNDASIRSFDVSNDAYKIVNPVTIEGDSKNCDITNDADVDTSSEESDEDQLARNEKVRHLSRQIFNTKAEIEKLKQPLAPIGKEDDLENESISITKEENIGNGTKANVLLIGDVLGSDSEPFCQAENSMVVKESNLEAKLTPVNSCMIESNTSCNLRSDSSNSPTNVSDSKFPAHSSTLSSETTSSNEFDSSLNLSSILVDTTPLSSSGTELTVSYNLRSHVTEYDTSADDLENNQVGNCLCPSEAEESHVLKDEDNVVGGIYQVVATAVGSASSNSHDIPHFIEKSAIVPHSFSPQDSSGLSRNTQSAKIDKLRDITNDNGPNAQSLQADQSNTSPLVSKKYEEYLECKPGKDRRLTENTSGGPALLNREITQLQNKLENLSLYSPEKAGRITDWVNQIPNTSSGQEVTRKRRSLKLETVENKVDLRGLDEVPNQQKDDGHSKHNVFEKAKIDKSIPPQISFKTEIKNSMQTVDTPIQEINGEKNHTEDALNGTGLKVLDVIKPKKKTRKERVDVTQQDNAEEDAWRLDEESDDDFLSCAETTTGSYHTVVSDGRGNVLDTSDSVSMFSCGDTQTSYYSMSSDSGSDSDETLVDSEHEETFHQP